MPVRMLLLALLAPVAAIAQNGAISSLVAETADYRIEAFRLPGGEAGNRVTSIVQGPNGFLWFGSQRGLHRYDGHAFITYQEPEGDTLENSSGLAFSYVENLYWDRFGKLWVCTYGGGLFCFDPQTELFKRYQYDPNDAYSISQDRVMCAAEDAEGSLWFGTEQEGVNRFDRKTERFERFLPNPADPKSLSWGTVKNIYLDKQGTLWIATGVVPWFPKNGGLNRYVPATNSFVRYTNEPDTPASLWANAVHGLLEDRRGNFWVCTAAGLQKMDREKGRFERMHHHPNKPYAPGTGIREIPGAFSLLEGRRGGLWVGTVSEYDYPSNLLRYDPTTGTVEEFPISIPAWRLFESRDGAIWVAGEGVLKITPKEPAYNLTQGAFIADEFRKTSIYRKLGEAHSESRLLGPLSMTFNPKDESMWMRYVYDARIGRDTAHYPILANYDRAAGETRFYHLKELYLNNLSSDVYSGDLSQDWAAEGLTVDEEGKIWGSYFSDSVGVFCFDPETGYTQNYLHNPKDPNSLLSNYVTIVMIDSRGEVWAGHHQKGLSRFDPKTEKWTRYLPDGEPPNKIGGYSPIALSEGRDGRIWVGGSTAEIHPFITLIDPISNTVQDFNFPESSARYVGFFAQKEETTLFTVDELGIGIASPNTSGEPMYFFSLDEDNFPIKSAAGIVLDRQGKLWVASYDRFACLDVEKETWFSFKNKNNKPNHRRRGLLGPDGHVYFPNVNKGWEEIGPKAILPPSSGLSRLGPVDLYIKDERQIPGKSSLLPKPVWELERLDIPQRALPFSIRFSSFHFQSPRVVYHYRLYPQETTWNILEDPVANYSYLPAGTYQFQVKAYTMYGLVDEKGIDLTIVLHPPWWKTWWANSLFAVAFLSLLAALFLYQRRRYQLQARLQLEQERAERLKEMDQFKSRFYTNITHEFRTPLTVIKGMADQISGQDKIKILILRNSESLLNMVNQLLGLSRLESNSLAVNWVQGDVIPYLQYLTESCHSLAHNKQVNLAFFSKEDSLVMDFDEDKLQHILINLLSNAIKFTPEYGSVKVTAAQGMDNSEPFLELAVSDTGKGIPKDKLPNIFNRFYQVDDSATRQGEGSGIGLALVKELVQLLEGQIKVDSEENKGTTFLVMLPIRNEAVALHLQGEEQAARKGEQMTHSIKSTSALHPAPPGPLSPAPGYGEQGKGESARPNQPSSDEALAKSEINPSTKPLILIIEDNADVTEYIISCLKNDYSLQTARNGREGVEKAREIVPDVILCDVMMPEMDGFEACRILKSERPTSHIPIILLTAKATQEDKVAGLSQGADAYLTKPFDKEELLVRLKNLAAVSKRLRERLSDTTTGGDQGSEQEQRETAFLKELHEIVETNMSDEDFDTNRLCRAAAMSRTQLHRKLKALTGQATASYIRSVRLRKAKALLETTDLPIGDIAVQVGYKDASHFSRSFGKEFGRLPSEVRK